MTSIKLTEIPLGYSAREALEVALGKKTGAAIYKQIVERVGRDPGPELGHGMKGVVYDLGDGRVLKLTADASEIEAMTLIRKEPHVNLVMVHDAFVVCRGKSGVGVVVREWVGNVLSNMDDVEGFKDSVSMAISHASDRLDEYEEDHDIDQAFRQAAEDLLVYLEDIGKDDDTHIIESGLRAGIADLIGMGVYGIDFDSRNIAVDNSGTAVIFDVGVVQIDPQAAVKVDRIGCTDRRIVSFSSE